MLIQRVPEDADVELSEPARNGGLQFYRGPWLWAQPPRMVRAPRDLGHILGFERLSSDAPQDSSSLVVVGTRGIALGQLDGSGLFTPNQYVVRFKEEYVPAGASAVLAHQSVRVLDVNDDRFDDIVWFHDQYVTVFTRDVCTSALAEERRCVRPPLRAPKGQP